MAQADKNTKTYARKTIAGVLAPYIVIFGLLVGAGGFIGGWTMRSSDNGRVQAAAADMVEAMSKTAKQ